MKTSDAAIANALTSFYAEVRTLNPASVPDFFRRRLRESGYAVVPAADPTLLAALNSALDIVEDWRDTLDGEQGEISDRTVVEPLEALITELHKASLT